MRGLESPAPELMEATTPYAPGDYVPRFRPPHR